MADYGFAVVGCGVISSVHLKAIAQVERANLVQIEALLDWIEGAGEPFVTGPDARRPVEVNLAIYASQRTGEKVKLPLEVEDEVGF